MAEQCAATNLKPLYLTGEAPSFYNWTSAVGFAKGKDGLRNRGFPAKMDLSALWCQKAISLIIFHVKPRQTFCQILLTSSHCLTVSPCLSERVKLLSSPASSRGHAVQAHVQGHWKRIHGEPQGQFHRWNEMWAGWVQAPRGFQSVCNGNLQSKWLGNPGGPLTHHLPQRNQFT